MHTGVAAGKSSTVTVGLACQATVSVSDKALTVVSENQIPSCLGSRHNSSREHNPSTRHAAPAVKAANVPLQLVACLHRLDASHNAPGMRLQVCIPILNLLPTAHHTHRIHKDICCLHTHQYPCLRTSKQPLAELKYQ